MLIVLEGSYFAEVGEERIAAGAGDAVVFYDRVPKVSWTDAENPARLLVICFYWNDPPRDAACQVHDEQGRLRLLAGWLREVEAEDQQLAENTLQALLAEYLRLSGKRIDPLVSELRRRMGKHLHESISLGTLAAWAGLSRCYLARRYRELTGVPPMQDLQRLRIQRARELILTTPSPLKAIAAQVGLNDASHLARLLRQHYGLTSKELRARVM
jgi:AraC-like DNA-binding protein